MAVTRKTHVERYYGKDENSDAWVDVEIIDKLKFETGRGTAYSKTVLTLEYDNPKRKTEQKRIVNPDDEDQWIEIPVLKSLTIERGRGPAYQKTVYHFDNTERNRTRKVHTKRVVHNNISDEFLDGDGKPPRDPEEYLHAVRATDEQEEDQYVETAVIEKLLRETGRGPSYSKTWLHLEWETDPLMREPLIDADN